MNKKILKVVIVSVILGLVVLAGIIGVVTMLEDADPDKVAQKEEQIKQETGYYARVSELVELSRLDESFAKQILDKVINDIGIAKLVSIEKGGVRGNYTFKADDYTLDVLIRGRELAEVRIGDALLYKNMPKDSALIIREKQFTYFEYDRIVTQLSKDFKLDKRAAARNFEILTSIGIESFTDVKKVKEKTAGQSKYKGKYLNIPLELVINGETISSVSLLNSEFGTIEVYSKESEVKGQHIRNHIPLHGERTGIPDGIAFQVGRALNDGSTVSLPITIPTGDDTWLLIKHNGTMHIEVNGDIRKGDKATSKRIIATRDIETGQITYLKVGKKEYIGGKV